MPNNRSALCYVSMLLLLLTISCASPAYAQSASADPSNASRELLKLGIKDFGQSRPLQQASRVAVLSLCCEGSLKHRDVVGISWVGPSDGYVLLLDSSRRPVDHRKTGFIHSISAISLDGRGDLLILDIVQGSGTGFRKDEFSVIDTKDGVLREVWKGTSLDRSFPLQADPNQNREHVGFLRIFRNETGEEVLEHVTQTTTFRVKDSTLFSPSVSWTLKKYVFHRDRFVESK